MCKLPVIALVFAFHAAANAASTATVNAADQSQVQQQRPITLYGHTAVIHGTPAAPYRPKQAARPEVKKTEELSPDADPGVKQEKAAPVKKKLKPVRFIQEVRRGAPFSCRDALDKIFEIISFSNHTRPQTPKTPDHPPRQ